MTSKEEKVLELFFNESSKHWHFEQILKAAKVSRSNAVKWLSKLERKGIILRTKPKGKMPYYIGNVHNPAYQNRKKIYALTKLHQSGFLDHLTSLPNTKVIILFGSFSRWDWYKESDIDLFIYGNDDKLDIARYETALNREIQLFTIKNKKELRKFSPGLLRNIINGYRVKGKPSELLEVIENAKVQNKQGSV